ncbi:hypothetical protein DCAR_0101019 [Daucus carota subsp. sativus]|uniref:Uncharacterized protein n=1 Tax=Daucus carota subsp. sativus TaxID=79200 RepID=A0A175YAH5_DAUCS|nr:hypothetical protein DCAR_0101019 [Daucus carota subsp. sativus]
MRLIKKTHTVSDAGLLPQTWSTNINSGNKNFQCTLKIYMNQALHCPQCPRPHWTNKIQHPAPELGQITGYLRTELLNRKLVNGIWTFLTALKIIKDTKCTFEVMLAPSSYLNTTGKLIVDGIVQCTKMTTKYPA